MAKACFRLRAESAAQTLLPETAMLLFDKGRVLFVGFSLLAAPAAQANAYLFRVDCKAETYVAQWASGPVDPGKDYFRIATGDSNLDCSIYDYNARLDQDLPRRWCSGPDGVSGGFPSFLILLGQSHCR
jgi:hypothetical protein